MSSSNRHSRLAIAAGMVLSLATVASAQWSRPKFADGVKIDQRLNSPLPLETQFRDEANRLMPLRTYFGDKPVILEIVYFNCTTYCPMTLMETVSSLKRVSLEPGRDYNVVVVSIDPKDTPAIAAEKKSDYSMFFAQKQGSAMPARSAASFNNGWHFLTGDEKSIEAVANAAGFHYRYDPKTNQYVHGAGIMVATPEGKLSRYLFGVQYSPADLRMALVQASEHRIGSPIDYIALLCFHYDPSQGKYTLAIFNILKIAAGLTILGLAGLIYFLMRKDKNRNPHAHARWGEVRHAR